MVPGLDGQKMSKSYGNTIEIFADEKAMKKKIMGLVTDSTPVEAPKDPADSTILALYRLVSPPEEVATMEDFSSAPEVWGTAISRSASSHRRVGLLRADARTPRRKSSPKKATWTTCSPTARGRPEAAAGHVMQRVRESIGMRGGTIISDCSEAATHRYTLPIEAQPSIPGNISA